MSVRECDVRPTWPVSAGWPLTLPTWIVLRAPAVHGVSSIKSSLIDVAFPEKQLYKCMLLREAMLTSSPPQAEVFKKNKA